MCIRVLEFDSQLCFDISTNEDPGSCDGTDHWPLDTFVGHLHSVLHFQIQFLSGYHCGVIWEQTMSGHEGVLVLDFNQAF